MLVELALRPTPASKCQRALSDLQTGKNKLIRDRTAELNRGRDPLLKQQHQTHLNMLNRHRLTPRSKSSSPPSQRSPARPRSSPRPRSGVEHRREPVGRNARTGHPPQPGAVSLAGLAPSAREFAGLQGRAASSAGFPAESRHQTYRTLRTLARRLQPPPIKQAASEASNLAEVAQDIGFLARRLQLPPRPSESNFSMLASVHGGQALVELFCCVRHHKRSSTEA